MNAMKAIDSNLQLLGADRSRYNLRNESAAAWIRSRQPVDIAFVDPPFGGELLQETCHRLAADGLVTTAVYLESGEQIDDNSLPEGWQLHRSKRAGHVHYGLVLLDGIADQS